jgi:MFS family permease
MQGSRQGRLFYGWVVVGVTVVVLLVSAGVRAAPGVLILPIEKGMGWNRTLLSTAVSIGLLLFGLAGPLTGWLIDRMGPRRVMLAGLTLIGLAMLASAGMNAPWQLLLFWGGLSGLGTGLVSSVMGATVANRWFVARRGLVVGIFGAATSAGQLIFLPAIVGMTRVLGWRGVSMGLAGLAALLLLPVFLLIRDSPADLGLAPYGLGSAPAASGPRPGALAVMQVAIRTPAFWLLAGTFFICGVTSNGLIGTHFVPYAIEWGVTDVTAASTLALMGMMNFAGTLGSGYLTDRYDPRVLLAVYYGFRGLSLLLLPFVHDALGLSIFAVLFGLDYIATVPPTTALVADAFGRENVGTVFGWVFCAHQVGASLAAWLGGVARESLGSYSVAFLAAGVLAGVATLMSLRIRRGLALQAA